MRPIYLEIHFFNGCCRCIHLCAVLSALSAQQDTSVSCAQVSCSLLSKIGTQMVQFLTSWHQKTTKPLSPGTLSDWKPLEKCYTQFLQQVWNQQALTGEETWLYHTLFLFSQLNHFLAGLILTAMHSIHDGVAVAPSHVSSMSAQFALVFLLLWRCGKIIQDYICASAVLFGVRWKHLFFRHSLLSVVVLQWSEWSWTWKRGSTSLRFWPATCPTVGQAHTGYETAPPVIDHQPDFVDWHQSNEALSFYNLRCSADHPEVARWTVKWTQM